MLPKWCACADKRHCVHGYCGYCGGRTYGGRHFDDDTPSGFLNCGREADLCHSDGLDQCPLVTCGVPYSAHAPTAARVHRELCLGFVA